MDSEVSEKDAPLVFENLLLRAGLARVELEHVLINAQMNKGFDNEEFVLWSGGEIADEELRPDRLELYREVVTARRTFDDCMEIARGACQ